MLTVKLYRGHTTRIVEATSVETFACGKAEGSDANPTLRTNKVREISVLTPGGAQEVFYVADDKKQFENSHGSGPQFGGSHFWNGAYIENAHGATTETVRPY